MGAKRLATEPIVECTWDIAALQEKKRTTSKHSAISDLNFFVIFIMKKFENTLTCYTKCTVMKRLEIKMSTLAADAMLAAVQCSKLLNLSIALIAIHRAGHLQEI
jgi:hypothetical protein